MEKVEILNFVSFKFFPKIILQRGTWILKLVWINVHCKARNNLSTLVTFSNGVMKIGVKSFFPENSIPSSEISIFSFTNFTFKALASLLNKLSNEIFFENPSLIVENCFSKLSVCICFSLCRVFDIQKYFLIVASPLSKPCIDSWWNYKVCHWLLTYLGMLSSEIKNSQLSCSYAK